MSNEQFKRDYKMTDSDLTVFTQHVCDCMTRDIMEFANYGVTATNVTALQTKNDLFERFPTDDYINQEYLSAVELRDSIYDTLHVTIRSMALRVELKWGKKSPKYKSLGISEMSKLPVNAYITEARMVHAFMEEHLTELTAEGLTQAMLDDMETDIQALDEAIRKTIEMSSYRMEMTTKRISEGNKIYGLVSKYCEIGKRIWDKVNPAFYNDYVIYDKSPGGLAAPKNLRAFRGSKEIMWDTVANAITYSLEMSLDQVEWVQIFQEEWNIAPVDFPDGFSYYRVRAHNAGGYGDYSDVLELEYYAVLPTPQNFRLELIEEIPKKVRCICDHVPTAESYVTYVSVVNIGSGPGSWTGAGRNEIPEVVNELVSGKRNYFQMQAQNVGQSSGKTPDLYIDVTV